jgi:cellulose synthase (UDP-forming)
VVPHAALHAAVVAVQALQGLAYAVAIAHLIKRRQAAWVPTGAASVKTPLARTVSWLAVGWLTVTVTATWVGLVYAGLVAGWGLVWATGFFAVAYTYLAVPLVRDAWRTLYPGERHREQRSGRAAPVELA